MTSPIHSKGTMFSKLFHTDTASAKNRKGGDKNILDAYNAALPKRFSLKKSISSDEFSKRFEKTGFAELVRKMFSRALLKEHTKGPLDFTEKLYKTLPKTKNEHNDKQIYTAIINIVKTEHEIIEKKQGLNSSKPYSGTLTTVQNNTEDSVHLNDQNLIDEMDNEDEEFETEEWQLTANRLLSEDQQHNVASEIHGLDNYNPLSESVNSPKKEKQVKNEEETVRDTSSTEKYRKEFNVSYGELQKSWQNHPKQDDSKDDV